MVRLLHEILSNLGRIEDEANRQTQLVRAIENKVDRIKARMTIDGCPHPPTEHDDATERSIVFH